MNRATQLRWPLAGLCGLLCVAGIAAAQTPAPAAQPSPVPAKKTTKPTAKHTPAKGATSRTTSSHTTSSRTATSRAAKNAHGKKVVAKRGQQGIDSARAKEIQAALIRQNYLHGEPSGSWDDTTQAAMRRYQADNGWQAKTIPDSRALIRLGLGPSSAHLLNPESAMTAAPAAGDPKDTVKPSPPDNLPKQ